MLLQKSVGWSETLQIAACSKDLFRLIQQLGKRTLDTIDCSWVWHPTTGIIESDTRGGLGEDGWGVGERGSGEEKKVSDEELIDDDEVELLAAHDELEEETEQADKFSEQFRTLDFLGLPTQLLVCRRS